MSKCNWEEIHGFESPGEYQRFCAWLDSQLRAEIIESVPVGLSKLRVPYGFNEKWFKCKESGEIWRLVAPEAPFHGSWEEVV